jgi:hypothetical protein
VITFNEYATKYQHIRMERRNGILQMTLHTTGGTLRWGAGPHNESVSREKYEALDC